MVVDHLEATIFLAATLDTKAHELVFQKQRMIIMFSTDTAFLGCVFPKNTIFGHTQP